MNKAAEFRNRAQNIWPGAQVIERGRGHIAHVHPSDPNKKMIDKSIGKIHYGANQDQEVDTAWQSTTGEWDWEMVLNDFQTFARDTFNVGDLFRFQKADQWVNFDPQSINWIDENISRQQIAIKQNVTAVVNDDILRFNNAYGAGIHFEYQNQTARLRKVITIDDSALLPEPTLQGNEIWFEAEFSLSASADLDIYLDDILWQQQNGVRVQTANRIEFRDSTTGEVRWWLDFARAWDSTVGPSNETFGQTEVRRQGGPNSLFITIRIPKTWLDTAVFPVFIDPTIDELVGASNHDAGETTVGNISLTGTRIGNVDSSAFDWGACQFDAITISAGSTIDTSYITFECPIGSLDEPLIRIYGEDVASPSVYSSTINDISNRTVTTEFTDWSNTGLGAPGFFNSPSLNSVIQELVDTYTYSSGVMAFQWTQSSSDSNRDFDVTSYDGSTEDCPALHIEYTESGGGGEDGKKYALTHMMMNELFVGASNSTGVLV